MPDLPRTTTLVALVFSGLCFLGDGRFPDNPTAPPTRHLSTLERMQMPRLEAVRDDIARLARERRQVPPTPGLRDFRTICHAHAGDSVHTGGTLPEMLADAKRAGVDAILLSDHFRPPRDFMNSWRGLKDGILFIPGSEARGFLIAPQASILDHMEAPVPDLLRAVARDGGLAFLSHIEERPQHSMEGLDGLEIYNRHWDAKRDFSTLIALALKLTNPAEVAALEEKLRRFPVETLAAQVDYPADYLEKWDTETPRRRLTGVAANDCHHNQVFVVKMVDESTVLLGTIVDPDDKKQRVTALLRPSIRSLTQGHQPGDTLVRLDFDPYLPSFQTVATHVLAPTLDEPTLREALRRGRAFVGFDWMGDSRGFRFEAHVGSSAEPAALPGDELGLAPRLELDARFPLPCSRIRLIRNGTQIALGRGYSLRHSLQEPGVYRVEGWLRLDGEERCWILSNPIYIRDAAH